GEQRAELRRRAGHLSRQRLAAGRLRFLCGESGGRHVRPHIAGNNLLGLYGGIEKLVPKAVIEPYVLWRLQQRLATETGTRGNLDFKTVGFRWVGKLPANFDYGTEIAWQTGSLGTDNIGAWAGHWVMGYTSSALR